VLFVSVKELELRKLVFDVDFPVGEIDFGVESVAQAEMLHAEGVAELLNNTLGEIRVRGKLNVEMELQCDRCLEPMRYPIEGPFDLFYRPASDTEDVPHEKALDAGESEIGFYDGDGMELSEIFREHILLSLPMHAVCREECAGICPQCGLNRNTCACESTQAPADDRWAALRELRGELRTSSKN
jgi:uncharacterized protein